MKPNEQKPEPVTFDPKNPRSMWDAMWKPWPPRPGEFTEDEKKYLSIENLEEQEPTP